MADKTVAKAAIVWWPSQRAWRTALQAVASSIIGIFAFVAVLAVLAPQFLEALKDILPPSWYAWLLGAVAFIGALATAFARIMAIPGVNEWLIRHSKFGTAPSIDAGTDGSGENVVTNLKS